MHSGMCDRNVAQQQRRAIRQGRRGCPPEGREGEHVGDLVPVAVVAIQFPNHLIVREHDTDLLGALAKLGAARLQRRPRRAAAQRRRFRKSGPPSW